MGTSLSWLYLAFLAWPIMQENMGLLIYVDLNPLPTSFVKELSLLQSDSDDFTAGFPTHCRGDCCSIPAA
jgi:hypothetical protein